MSTRRESPLVRRASHSAVSLAAGFLTGVVLFLALGAALNDAVFSALTLAALVAASRTLLGTN